MRMPKGRIHGFTLVELVMVLVIVGVLSAYAFIKNATPAAFKARSQAETFAGDIRHVQSLATTTARRLRVDLPSSTTYQVCALSTDGTSCTLIKNPVTGSDYVVTITDAALSGTSMVIDRIGSPGASDQTYTMTAGGQTFTITVAALTGKVSISP